MGEEGDANKTHRHPKRIFLKIILKRKKKRHKNTL